MKSKNLKGNIMLFITAFVWGIAFVAQSVGMDYVGAHTFNAVRFYIGGIVLIPCIFLLKKLGITKDDNNKKDTKKLFIGGISCGVFLFAASAFQQIGIQYTSVGKAGFITALYIILVPIVGIAFKRKAGYMIWISAIVAIIGMFLLCVTEEFSIASGDILVFICALLFTGHILTIDHFSPYVDGVKMSCIQFFTSGVLATIFMFIFEEPSVAAIIDAKVPILYAGIMSCGVAYTLQILGQQHTSPFVASFILSLESVFAVIAGFILLNQKMSIRELVGCLLVFVAVILAQIPTTKKSETKEGVSNV